MGFLSDASAAEAVIMTSQASNTNHGSNAPSFYQSDTSADELSFDHGPSDKRSKGPWVDCPQGPATCGKNHRIGVNGFVLLLTSDLTGGFFFFPEMESMIY